MTAILAPIGWLYGKIADARNALYERGWLKSFPLGAWTISIGNITAGGTGKTPLVAFVSEMLAEKGARVCVLTRGYGRRNPRDRVLVSDGENVLVDAKAGGDEPVELARKLIGKAVVIADADRVSAAKWAKEKFAITAFVLDDGFQHRRARRDLDIVCIDATDPCGGGRMLPAGRQREPLDKLKRADAVVITRANLVDDIGALRSRMERLAPDSCVFTCESRVARLTTLDEFLAKPNSTNRRGEFSTTESDMKDVKSSACFAFCGLGNPGNFFSQLQQEQFGLKGTHAFLDHHIFSQDDIASIESDAKTLDAEVLLTTAKDAVKLTSVAFSIPCYVVEIELLIDNHTAFGSML
jgi:tetraacyldisaccharide 4'-kinase